MLKSIYIVSLAGDSVNIVHIEAFSLFLADESGQFKCKRNKVTFSLVDYMFWHIHSKA